MTAASNSRIQSSTLEDDIDAFLALETISTYAPNNPEHSLPASPPSIRNCAPIRPP